MEEREAALRRALRDNSEKWLYIMPLRAAGPTTQTRAEEEPPRQDAGARPPTAKAVVELKPKSLLTQNMSRQENC